MTSQGEALLTMADYNGTLSAARSLDRAGVRVVVADPDPLARTCCSRHAALTERCPDANSEPDAFLRWLLEYGERAPGSVLYATSDDVAFVISRHRDELSRWFRMYTPPFSTVYALLNKWRLYRACVEVGIDAPQTWLPADEDEVGRLAREARFPLIVKPQTQALLAPHQKGRLVLEPAELLASYRSLRSQTKVAKALLAEDEGAAAPVVQTYLQGASTQIENLSGFIDESSDLLVAQASRKVLQWPRRLGIGLCFEAVPAKPALLDAVSRLCRHVGYHGAFEVEFVPAGDRYFLIDFNPRFYGQMQFDVARGLDLPRFVYLAAAGRRAELARAVRGVRGASATEVRAYCSRIDMKIALAVLRAAGRLEEGESRRWRTWLRMNRGKLADAVIEREDWLPSLIAAARSLLHRLAHARSTWRAARAG